MCDISVHHRHHSDYAHCHLSWMHDAAATSGRQVHSLHAHDRHVCMTDPWSMLLSSSDHYLQIMPIWVQHPKALCLTVYMNTIVPHGLQRQPWQLQSHMQIMQQIYDLQVTNLYYCLTCIMTFAWTLMNLNEIWCLTKTVPLNAGHLLHKKFHWMCTEGTML